MTITGIHAGKTGPTGGTPYEQMFSFASGLDGQDDACVSDFEFFIRDRLPTWVQIENPNFVDFFTAFYEYLKCKQDVSIDPLVDLDSTKDDFYKTLKKYLCTWFSRHVIFEKRIGWGRR